MTQKPTGMWGFLPEIDALWSRLPPLVLLSHKAAVCSGALADPSGYSACRAFPAGRSRL